MHAARDGSPQGEQNPPTKEDQAHRAEENPHQHEATSKETKAKKPKEGEPKKSALTKDFPEIRCYHEEVRRENERIDKRL